MRLLPVLRDELAALKANARDGSDDRVFPTQKGGRLNDSNFRSRVLGKPATTKDGKPEAGTGAIGRANKRLEAADATPLPQGLSPHKLRHTFRSLLVALGTDPGVVMDELGHADPGCTLRVYRHGMRRDEDSRAQLAALVGRDAWEQRRRARADSYPSGSA